ncbi:MAG TPA: hypothetical protein PKH96_19385, partial [Gemmatimonadaceae bacterium]|nr:hypothetical protein [Gemmatimonadaceae bacterium]
MFPIANVPASAQAFVLWFAAAVALAVPAGPLAAQRLAPQGPAIGNVRAMAYPATGFVGAPARAARVADATTPAGGRSAGRVERALFA